VAAILALIGTGHLIEDTLPPLIHGKVAKNLDELWRHYDPRKEPLATEVLKEWEQNGRN